MLQTPTLLDTDMKWIVICLAAISLSGCNSYYADGTVKNVSKKSITSLEISFADKPLVSSKLPAGETVSWRFRIRNESHYVFDVIFEDGSHWIQQTGYLTPSWNFNEKYLITDAKVVLIESGIQVPGKPWVFATPTFP